MIGVPVGVGFGIRDAATAAPSPRIADAVVIGSRIIEEIEGASPTSDAPRGAGASSPTFRGAACDAAIGCQGARA